jgi:chemotaxis protein CheZ
MGEPRKVFRIEGIAAARRAVRTEDTTAAPGYADVMQELSALRALIAPSVQSATTKESQRGGVQRLAAALTLIHDALRGTQHGRSVDKCLAPMTHIAHELEAVSKGSEEATQKILAAAEDIDQVADNLTAALKDEIDRGLAQDIRDRVVQIFEACNFQDLTSQRVAKVTAALKGIEAGTRRDHAYARRAGDAWTAARKRQRPRLATRYRSHVRPRVEGVRRRFGRPR